jgi:hypothetical protein
MFDLEKEKQELIEFLELRTNQSVEEYTFWDKYHEIQDTYDKKVIDKLKEKLWIGGDKITPKLILVENKKQMDDWRHIIRFTSSFKNVSTPGRSLKYIVIDEITDKYIGALTVTSDFGSLGVRDNKIGWTGEQRFQGKKLNHLGCGQAIIPIQPFGFNRLGGKLLAMLVSSKKVREDWKNKYGDTMVGMTTTSLYGTECQYNRLPNFKKMGKTTGKMSIRPPREIINRWIGYFVETQNEIYLKYKEKADNNRTYKQKYFTDDILGVILKEIGWKRKQLEHGFKRGVFFAPFYENTNEFLRGEITEEELVMKDFFNRDTESIMEWWEPRSEKRIQKLESENRIMEGIQLWDCMYGMTYEEAKQNFLTRLNR